MFTGIVEYRGRVLEKNVSEGITTLTLDSGPLNDVSIGDSVSVTGVCLTAVEVDPHLVVQVVNETLNRTNLGQLQQGGVVNLERAMPVSGRFDGHVVQGHVDGVGTVIDLADEGDGKRVSVQIPPDLLRYVVEKGSITIDGVSLTVAAVQEEQIEIALIPHTLQLTTLGLRNGGDAVNLEVDVLAKYVERILKAAQ